VGFEARILASERAKTVHALDRAATVTDNRKFRVKSKEFVAQNIKRVLMAILGTFPIFSRFYVREVVEMPSGVRRKEYNSDKVLCISANVNCCDEKSSYIFWSSILYYYSTGNTERNSQVS
jgi:hypothetical protein